MKRDAVLSSLLAAVYCTTAAGFLIPSAALGTACRWGRKDSPKSQTATVLGAGNFRFRSTRGLRLSERGEGDENGGCEDRDAEERRSGIIELGENKMLLAGVRTSSASKPRLPATPAVVGDPQRKEPVKDKEYSIETVLKELAEIQNEGRKNYCVLGTRHCSFLHQQIIELLAYALVLSGNHVFTSGAMGTNAATIRGALRAEQDDLLTVVLPQSLSKQDAASQTLLKKVKNVIVNPKNDDLPLDEASRMCNSDLLSRTDQLICFAYHDSNTIIQTSVEARENDMIVTELYLD